jgi:DNA-nicking Smr family endonuclease
MSKKPGGAGGKKPVLTDEDHELWEHTAKSLEPLKRAKSRVHEALEDEAALAKAMFTVKPHHQDKKAKVVTPPPPAPAKRKAPDLHPFDQKAVRKLRRGHIDIEARIDLHGMRQAEAHAALVRFLHASAAKGRRWVLVITGKGSPARRPNEHPDHPFGEPQRGILKRSVPLWLAEPDIRPLIVSFTEAAIEHGGSGALYVHLRRARHGHD